MKISILNENGKRMSFVLSESNAAFANALRRIMATEVPTMAIEFVDFEKNSTGLYDEVIAHRLGLIPLTFDKKVYKLKSECSCKGKGCSKCQAVLSYDSSKSKATAIDEYITVKSGDMVSDDETVRPVSGDIPIVEILEDQELKFDAVASLGTAKEHAKWQAANVGYTQMPSVKISSEKCEGCGQCVEVCPQKIFNQTSSKVSVKNPEKCTLCMRCTEVCEKGAVAVSGDDKSFVFTVESVSGLTPREILEQALEILENKVGQFIKELK